MQALAASCEELRARTGNPPLDPILNGGNMHFRQTIFIGLVFAKLFSIMMKNMSFNSQMPDLYDYEKITFIH
jgi:hypothetical protein